MFILTSILWIILLVVTVNRATKNAYADGYDVGYVSGANGWEHDNSVPQHEPEPRTVVSPRSPARTKHSMTSADIDAFLERERIKI